jgi:hypothetical protein
MRALHKQVFILLAWAIVGLGLATSPLFAANGKVAGVVKDRSSGEVIPGANVTTMVGATTVGAVTDSEGQYFLLNLQPGVYTIKVGFVGYQPVEKTDVRVRSDLTTEVNFDISEQAIEGEAITVVAERPLIEKTLTSSRTSIDASEINNTMPVADLSDLIDTSPSVFRGFVRGGRKSESKILVDGIDVSDTYFRAGEGTSVYSPYTSANRSSEGEFGVGINVSSVQSLDIISGTFNAEYDAASAGVINVVTREGGEKYDGRIFVRSGSGTKNAGPDVYTNTTKNGQAVESDLAKYNLERTTLLNSGDAANIAKAVQFYNFNAAQNTDYGDGPTEAEVSVGGPLGGVGGFYFTTRYNNAREYLPYGHHVSMRHSLKLTFKPSDSGKLTANFMIDDEGKLGGWTNRDFASRFKFYHAGYPGNKKLGLMGYLGWTQSLSPKTFYEIKVSQLNRTSEFGYSDDNGNGRVDSGEDGDFIVLKTSAESDKYLGLNGSGILANGQRSFFTPDPGNEKFFNLTFANGAYRIGQPGFYYEDLDRNVFQIKADVTSQLNFNHQVKAGLLYRRHEVSQFQQRTQVRVTYDNAFPFEITDFSVNPSEYALYVQDRIEYDGIIINGGVRLDGFNVGVKNFTDFFNPSAQTTLANGQIVREQIRGKSVDTKWFIQPRLGISHPITESAAMHYSWGKFYSPPSFSSMYDNFGVFANPSLPFVVDVDADPVQATAYEIGVQYGIDRNHLLDVTAYYRDIENYGRISYAINPVAGLGFGSYTFNTSFGYADSRGVELSLERRAGSPWISGRLNYAFSYIKSSAFAGNTSHVPDQTSFSSVTDTDIPLEARATFNTYQQNVNGGGNPLVTGFDRKHRVGMTLTGDFSSLTPGESDRLTLTSISTLNSGFYYRVEETTTDVRDREVAEGPWTFRTDMRLTYGFKLSERFLASAFFEVRNLFDRENIQSFDRSTNNSRRDWETNGDPTGELNRAYSDEGSLFYDIPREVNFGFSVDF